MGPPILPPLLSSVIVKTERQEENLDEADLRASEPHFPSASSEYNSIKYEFCNTSEPSVLSHQGRHFVQTANMVNTSNINNQIKNCAETQSENPRKKRGRKPKINQLNQPTMEEGEESNKKFRDELPTLPQHKPFSKPCLAQLKETGESFLQDGPCCRVAPKLMRCRECNQTNRRSASNMPHIFCRFYAFRILQYNVKGRLTIAGFCNSYRDVREEHLQLWLPMPDSPPTNLDLNMSRFLLRQLGDQFCHLVEQEKEAIAINISKDKTIAWKRIVQGVREMCDMCQTTLFNFHWVCGKCGFVVCIDCYKSRKNHKEVKKYHGCIRAKDPWLVCSTIKKSHVQENLMLTQIIAGDSLEILGKKTHEARARWRIPMHCGCPLANPTSTPGFSIDQLQIKTEPKDVIEIEKEETTDNKNCPLNWLADVALSNSKQHSSTHSKKLDDFQGWASSSDSDEDDYHHGSLRERLLGLPLSNGFQSPSFATQAQTRTKTKKSQIEILNEVISIVIDNYDKVKEDDDSLVTPPQIRRLASRYNWSQKSWKDPVPIRVMTLTESEKLYPGVPHSWLCEGRLLRLIDPNHPGNYKIFQDQWMRGQPVIVSNVSKNLNIDLWLPESFIRDFGEVKNDLVNCMTGELIPNQSMGKFWSGFQNVTKRLKDAKGNTMLLKLKDWPPGEDFAELLPSRFANLMQALPLGEYTHRTGRLNLASRLPYCFVRPDLGPKMYTAYGSAFHPNKGTTNLHLDISDAVNVMVYVGIPTDADYDTYIKEAYRVIDEAQCDVLTIRRVYDRSEMPGALWHIYAARDANKIRDLLNRVAIERGVRLEAHHDPIHDQIWYLDKTLRERLYIEYNVQGYAIVQCLGDAVFIPAGAPHQVLNLHNCIKVAEDFVSPENVSHCFHLTQEFRDLSDTHTNHEDKLQIKNIIYHAVKDSLSVIGLEEKCTFLKQEIKTEPIDL